MRLPARLSSRASWTLLDQIASSASNFAFIAVVANTTSRVEFGAFSLTYLVYAILLGCGRAGNGDILLLRAVERPGAVRADSVRLLVIALQLALVGGVALLAASLLTSHVVSVTLQILALGLPWLLLQDAVRFCFFAAKRPQRALLNDTLWLGAQVATVGAVLLLIRDPGPTPIIFAWAGAAAIAAFIGLFELRPRFAREALRRRRSERSRVRSFIFDFLLVNGAVYSSTFVIAAISGLTVAGAVRGAVFLFAPLGAICAGLQISVLPALGSAAKRGSKDVRATATRIGVAYGIMALGYGLLMTLLPSTVGRLLLGDTWETTKPLLIGTAVVYIAHAVAIASHEGVRALGAGRMLVWLSVAGAIVALAGASAGTAIGDARGAIIGMAIGWGLKAAFWWFGFRLASRTEVSDVPSTHPTGLEQPPRMVDDLA